MPLPDKGELKKKIRKIRQRKRQRSSKRKDKDLKRLEKEMRIVKHKVRKEGKGSLNDREEKIWKAMKKTKH